jgi:hypothetical protein
MLGNIDNILIYNVDMVRIYVQFGQLYFNKNEAVDLRCISDDNKRRCLLGYVPITRSFSSYLGIF